MSSLQYFEKTFLGIDFDFNPSTLVDNILSGKEIYHQIQEKVVDILVSEYVQGVWMGEFPPHDLNPTEIVDELVECILQR